MASLKQQTSASLLLPGPLLSVSDGTSLGRGFLCFQNPSAPGGAGHVCAAAPGFPRENHPPDTIS